MTLRLNENSTMADIQRLKEELGCADITVVWKAGRHLAFIKPKAVFTMKAVSAESEDPWEAINLAAQKFIFSCDTLAFQAEQKSNFIHILESNLLTWLDDELKSLEDNLSEEEVGNLPRIVRGLAGTSKEYGAHVFITHLLTYALTLHKQNENKT